MISTLNMLAISSYADLKEQFGRFWEFMCEGSPAAIACGVALGTVLFCILGYFCTQRKSYLAIAASAGLYLVPFFLRGF